MCLPLLDCRLIVAGKLGSDAAAACKPWRCSTPCGNQTQAHHQQQQQRASASLHGDPHQQHQPTLAGLYSGVSLGSQAMSDYAAAAAAGAVSGGLLDSKPAIIAASMF